MAGEGVTARSHWEGVWPGSVLVRSVALGKCSMDTDLQFLFLTNDICLDMVTRSAVQDVAAFRATLTKESLAHVCLILIIVWYWDSNDISLYHRGKRCDQKTATNTLF